MRFRFFIHLCLTSVALSTPRAISKLEMGLSIRGTTRNATREVSLASYLGAGQAIHAIHVPQNERSLSTADGVDIRLSTCSAETDFDTVLILYQKDPSLARDSPNLPLVANDNDCGMQSTVEFRGRQGRSYFVLVTGRGSAEGNYDLSFSRVFHDSPASVPWGLDRIDQRNLPLDGEFSVHNGGAGVYIYILDSGVRTTHDEFLNATTGASRAEFGVDLVDRNRQAFDCTGHGTHVAGIAVGRTFGVAKRARVVSVRVLDCDGKGYTSRLTEGLHWVLLDVQRRGLTGRAVVSLSLSTHYSQVLNAAVRDVTSNGIAVVTAAGNSYKDSCSFSPASEESAITVAAVSPSDILSNYSNSGLCINLFAPGTGIPSAWHTGDFSSRNSSGTSAACPHVTGAVAVLLAENPLLNPREVSEVLSATATFSAVSNHYGSTENLSNEKVYRASVSNRLLFVRQIPQLPQQIAPDTSMMFIYVVFALRRFQPTLSRVDCLLSKSHNETVTDLVSSSTAAASISPKVQLQLCCALSDCGFEKDSESSSWLIVRIEQADHLSAATFGFLEAFTNSEYSLQTLSSSMGIESVAVAVEPWVVDSRGYKYWAAPALLAIKDKSVSSGPKIAVTCVICSVTVLLTAVMLTFLCRRHEKAKEEEYKQYVDQFENDHIGESNITMLQLDTGMEIPHDAMRRENTGLVGSILRMLSSSATLMTPRNHRGGEDSSFTTPSNTGTSRQWSQMLGGVDELSGSKAHIYSKRVVRGTDAPSGGFRVAPNHSGQQQFRERHRSPEQRRIPQRQGGIPRIISYGPGHGALAGTPHADESVGQIGFKSIEQGLDGSQ